MARSARLTNRLTVRECDTAELKPVAYFKHDGDGLLLRVDPAGAKSWILRYRFAGKRHDMGLGAYRDVSLKVARERAHKMHALIRPEPGVAPINPKEQFGANAVRRQLIVACVATSDKTFADVAEEYIAKHEAGWKSEREAPQWRASLRNHAKLIMPMELRQIGEREARAVLEPIWREITETASRIRYRCELIMTYAMASKYCPEIANPFRWEGYLKAILPAKGKITKEKHFAKLPVEDMPGFMVELRAANSVAARALEFVILTIGRPEEVVGATWAEIDLEKRVWTIPADRMKKSKEHRVPLSDAAIALLQGLPGDRRPKAALFPGHGTPHLTKQTVLAFGKTLRPDVMVDGEPRSVLTTHGQRGTFSDWGHDHPEFKWETIEQCLAHKIGDNTTSAYYTSDALNNRRAVLAAWSDFLAGVEDDAKVVTLRSA
jgi:integrase